MIKLVVSDLDGTFLNNQGLFDMDLLLKYKQTWKEKELPL